MYIQPYTCKFRGTEQKGVTELHVHVHVFYFVIVRLQLSDMFW